MLRVRRADRGGRHARSPRVAVEHPQYLLTSRPLFTSGK